MLKKLITKKIALVNIFKLQYLQLKSKIKLNSCNVLIINNQNIELIYNYDYMYGCKEYKH